MSENDDGLTPPRHRKSGRASKRGSSLPGRHLRVVTEDGPAQECACPPGYHEYGTHAPGQRPSVTPLVIPAGAYPVEDLAAMSAAAAEMLLHRATIEAGSVSETFRHVVITRDTATGVVTHSGPFDDGLQALTVANDFVEKFRDLHPRWEFTLTVAPIFPS